MLGLKVIAIVPGLVVFSGLGWNQKIKNQDEFAKGLAKEYCSAAATISTSAQYRMEEFSHSNNLSGIINDFGTYIHENYHAYNWSINTTRGIRKYYINDNLVIKVPEVKMFNSIRINRIVPNELEGKIFRYKDYVGSIKDQNVLDSKVNGIYGLLEEFSAYYQGSKAVLELYPYLYNTFGYRDFEPWHDYMTIQTSSLYALYEFQLFISWYLQYAKIYEPATYQYIINSREIRLLYSVIVTEFEKEVEKYFLIREVVMGKFGKRFRLDNEYLHIDADGDGWYESGLGIPDDDMRFLKQILDRPEHQILGKIRLGENEIDSVTKFSVRQK